MSTSFTNLVFYCASFLAVWWGSGLVVSAVSKIANGLKLPAFIISFFVLGILTSLPEMAIGLTSISTGDPDIFVGNLIGGSIVLFLFVIPLLGLLGNGISVPKQLNRGTLAILLVVIFLPTLLIRDRQVQTWEAFVAMAAYLVLYLVFSKQRNLVEKVKQQVETKRKVNGMDVLKILVGVSLLLIGSNQIVASTVYFAQLLVIDPFLISLVVVSLGTNIPELALVFRSIASRKTDVALADYLGSAAANTLLFGALSFLYSDRIIVPNHYVHRFLFIIVGLILMYFFMRSKNKLTKTECAILLSFYIAFIIMEVLLT